MALYGRVCEKEGGEETIHSARLCQQTQTRTVDPLCPNGSFFNSLKASLAFEKGDHKDLVFLPVRPARLILKDPAFRTNGVARLRLTAKTFKFNRNYTSERVYNINVLSTALGCLQGNFNARKT